MGRSFLGIAVCALGLISASPADAAITASNISTPANGAELFFNGDNGSGSVTVRGTVTNAIAGDKGDLRCYIASDTSFTVVAAGIDVSSGSFATSASLKPIAGQACRLAMVPAGGTATPAVFTGPAVSVSDQFSHSSSGNLWGYYILTGTLSWSFAFQSVGDCPVTNSYATDPATLGSFPLFAGNACLPKTSGVGAGAGTRSALQIDDQNAYPPAAISGLSSLAGFEPLSYSAGFDAAHDAVIISETEIPTVCDPPATYPPAGAACPSLHDSGIEIQQTTALLPGGQVARVAQRFISVDGRSHLIDALFAQSVKAPLTTDAPGFQFPGQTSLSSQSKPYAFSAFPPGPGSIITIADAGGFLPATSNPIGAITYNRAPVSADFISAPGAQTGTFLMHYEDSIPPGGSVQYDWSFSQASSSTGLAAVEQIERDRFSSPSVAITSPRNGGVTTSAEMLVRGRVSDAVGISSLTVNGRGVAVTGGTTFATVIRLRVGRNVIAATATNVAGNTGGTYLAITYKLPPCKVPRLRGKTLAAARHALALSGCNVGKVMRVHSSKVRKGRVVSSKPGAGSTRRRGTKVSLVLSRGR